MNEEFLNRTENPRLRQDFGEQAHRLAPMFLIGVFTDEDSSLELAHSLRPAVLRRDSRGRVLTAAATFEELFEFAL